MSHSFGTGCSVGDVAATTKNALVGGPFGSNLISADYVPVGVPVIRGQNMGLGRWVGGEFAYVSEEKAKSLSANIARPGDIVFTQRGTLGQVAIVPDGPFDRYVISQSQMKLTVDLGKTDALFLYYVFSTAEQQEHIRLHAIQTGVPHTNLGLLRGTPLRLPSLPVQKAIAHILGALDDKIELNRRKNKTLEDMARAIFKSWFVDFDPVRAKAAGLKPPGLKPDLAALFPNAFENSALGKIPKGWKVRPIGDVVQVLGGGTPSTKEPAYWEGGIHPFCTPKDMSSLTAHVLLQTERHLSDEGLERVSSGQLPVGTVLLSSRAPIGYLAIAETPVSINQGIIAMICNGELPNLYVLYWTAENMERVIANANGSTFLEISKQNFRPITALIPKQDILRQFMQIVAPLHQRISLSIQQNHHLAAIRDTLLPKLISGELRVSDAERIMGRAV
jgi:type I restriction enzyme S subunit